MFVEASRIALLDSWGALNSGWVISHAVNPAPGDAELLKKNGAHMSSAPSTAMQSAMGHPTALYHETEDFFSHASIGGDSTGTNGASIPLELRLALMEARASYARPFVDKNLVPARLNRSTEDAFNLGTIKGARAMGMANKIGSLKPGMLADIVVFDATTPSLYGYAQKDPVEAIVLHSSQRDVDLVMVDGIIRKEHGKLVDVELASADRKWLETEDGKLSWKDVSAKVNQKINVMDERIKSLDLVQLRESVFKLKGVNRSCVVEHV